MEYAHDYIWYLWGGKDSPLFDKKQDGYFRACALSKRPETHKEKKALIIRYESKRKFVIRYWMSLG